MSTDTQAHPVADPPDLVWSPGTVPPAPPAGELAARGRPAAGAAGSPLQIRPEQTGWTPVQRAALTQLGLGEAPEADIQVFFHVAQRTGLDVFARQIYMIGRWDPETSGKKWTIQTGIDGFRVVSERHPAYAGVGDPAAEWCGLDGVWKDVWLDKLPPVAARFTVHRRDQERPIRAVARFAEYVDLKADGTPKRMWGTARGKPAHMLAKCAEALTRRMAFPQDLAGLYTDDEMAAVEREQDVRVADNGRPVFDADPAPAAAGPDWSARTAELEAAGDRDGLASLWKIARAARAGDEVLNAIAAAGERLSTSATAAADADRRVKDARNGAIAAESAASADERPAAPPGRLAGEPQRKRMVLLIAEAGVSDDEQRRHVQAVMAGRPIESSKDLSNREAAAIIELLQTWKQGGRLAHEVAALLPRVAEQHDPLPNPSRPDEWHKAGHPVRESDGSKSYATSSPDCSVCPTAADEHAADERSGES